MIWIYFIFDQPVEIPLDIKVKKAGEKKNCKGNFVNVNVPVTVRKWHNQQGGHLKHIHCESLESNVFWLLLLNLNTIYHTRHVSYVAQREQDLLHRIFVLKCQEYSDQGRQTGQGLPDNSVLREITDGGWNGWSKVPDIAVRSGSLIWEMEPGST